MNYRLCHKGLLVDSDEWNTANAISIVSSATLSWWNYAKAVRKGGEHW